ncbi:hypothetical protein VNO78_02976 [Psophocarpus tetragonolobus]|uniref:Uncharacterized protein n=1 Tax=Psophocarpus tetragonolobus TaxID=3891 RepID=A0AAN9XW68_PSOTE
MEMANIMKFLLELPLYFGISYSGIRAMGHTIGKRVWRDCGRSKDGAERGVRTEMMGDERIRVVLKVGRCMKQKDKAESYTQFVMWRKFWPKVI